MDKAVGISVPGDNLDQARIVNSALEISLVGSGETIKIKDHFA